MSSADEVDWAAADRYGTGYTWLAVPGFIAFVAAFTALHLRLQVVTVILISAVLVALSWAALTVAARRRDVDPTEARRIAYAMRHHVDPGPLLRERVDRQAHHLARLRWLSLSYPLLAVSQLTSVEWEPLGVTVPAACIVVVFFLSLSALSTVQVRSARRWLADPPGPDREPPPPDRWDSLLGWRWLGIAAVGCLAVGVLLGLLAVLID